MSGPSWFLAAALILSVVVVGALWLCDWLHRP
jgi:hypothetical protein